jgi:hypothetical protein
MSKLNMKIHGYDERNDSLLVSFSTDVSMKPVDQYQVLAFQPHRMGVSSPGDVVKAIAQAGIQIAKQQDLQDAAIADTSNAAAYNSMIGETLSFDETELAPTLPPNLTTVV